MQGRDKSARGRSLGPFTGRQLTTIICVGIVALVTIPTAAFAARGAFTNNTAAPAVTGTNSHPSGIGVQGTGKRYGVYSNGPLGVAAGKKLSCTGCVEPKALSTVAQTARLKPGESVSGPYSVQIVDPTMRFIHAVIDYPRPLASPIAADKFVYTESWPAAHCPGPGKAARGYLCAYSTVSSENINPTNYKLFPIGVVPGRAGAIMGFAPVLGNGFTETAGSFTVTAP